MVGDPSNSWASCLLFVYIGMCACSYVHGGRKVASNCVYISFPVDGQ